MAPSSPSNTGKRPPVSSKRRSAFDLKDQLSDLQNKLQPNQGSKKRLSTASGNNTTNTNITGNSGENPVLSSLPNVFPNRNRDDSALKRSSLPPMPMSAGSNSNANGRSSNDVSFVVGLSENLLLECRRLTAENGQYKEQLRDSKDELQRVNKQLTNMAVINKKYSEETEKMKDQTWELEGLLQDLTKKHEKLQIDHSKLSQAKETHESTKDQLKNEIEMQKAQNLQLSNELSTIKQQLTNDTKYYKNANEELNNENDTLHKTVSELKDQVEILKTSSQKNVSSIPPLANAGFFQKDDSDSDNDDFSVLDDPESSSPVKDTPSRNVELEKETIHASLMHSNRTIAKLRSTLLKVRAEKEELAKQVTASQKSAASTGSPVRSKNTEKAKSGRSPMALKRNSKAISVGDSERNWGDFSLNDPSIGVAAPIANDTSSDEEIYTEALHQQQQGHALLSQDLETDTEALAQQYAAEHNLVLVPADEFNRLKQFDDENIAIPRELLERKCALANIVAVDKEDFEELQAKVNHEPTEAELIERIQKFDSVVVLPIDEHQNLKQSIETPSFEYLKAKAANSHNGILLTEEEYHSLKHPKTDAIKDIVAKDGLLMIPVTEHELLTAKASHEPTVQELTEKLQSHGNIVLPVEEHQNLIQSIESPSLDYLKAKLSDNHKNVTLSEEEHNELLNPSTEAIKELASRHQHMVISATDHEALNARANYEPSEKELTEKLQNSGKVVLPADEHQRLVENIESPSLDYLKHKLSDVHNCVALTEEEHYDLLNPSTEAIKTLASRDNHVVIPATEHDALISKANYELTEQELTEKLQNHGNAVIPIEEHQRLVQNVESPSLDYLKSKLFANHNNVALSEQEHYDLAHPSTDAIREMAEKESLVVLPLNEHSTLMQKATAPTVEELTNHAIAHDSVVVPKNQYEELQTKAEKPSSAHLYKVATAAGLVLLSKDEHTKLSNIASEPSIDFLKSKADKAGYKLLAADDHQLLKSLAEESIQTKAQREGFIALPESEYSSLLQEKESLASEISSPKLDYLVDKATSLGQIVVAKAAYDNLLKEAETPLEQKASAQNMVLLESAKYDDLLHTIEKPSLDFLSAKAAIFESNVVPSKVYTELMAAQETLQNPSFEILTSKAEALGSKIVTAQEYEQLQKTKTAGGIKELAKGHDLALAESDKVVLPADQHDKMTADHSNLEDPLNNPSKEYLASKAASCGMLLVERNEYDELVAAKDEPLEARANRENFVLVPQEEFANLKSVVDNPDVTFLKEKAEALSHTVITTEELSDLKRKAFEPSHEDLKAHAEAKNLVLVDHDTHANLIETTTSPTLDFIRSAAVVHSVSVVDTNEYKELVASTEEPLDEKAKKRNSVLLPENEYKRLSFIEATPAIEFMKEKAKDQGFEIVPISELQELRDFKEEPLQSKANKEGMLLLSIEEHQQLETNVATLARDLEEAKQREPEFDQNSLTEAATTLGLAVLTKDDYENLASAAVSPSLEHLKDHAQKKDHILLPKWKHEILEKKATNPSEDEIRSFAKPLGLKVVETTEFDTMKMEASNPSRETLTKAATQHNLVLLTESEFELLKNKAERILPAPINTSLDDFAPPPHSPSLPSSPASPNSQKSKVLSSKERFEEMIRQENEVKINQKLSAAKALGLVTLSTEEYKGLLSKQQVNEPTISDIYNGAKTFGLTVLPQAEYKTLLKKQLTAENPEELANFARSLGFTIVPLSAMGKREIGMSGSEHQLGSSLGSMASSVSLSQSEEFHDAASHMSSKVSLISSDVYEDALSRPISHDGSSINMGHDNNENIDLEFLTQRAAELGFKLVPADDYETDVETTSIEDNDETYRSVIDNNTNVDSGIDLTALQHQLDTKTKELEELQNHQLSKDELMSQVSAYGLVAITAEEYDALKRELDDEGLKASAKLRGFAMIEFDEYNALMEDSKKANMIPTVASLTAAAAALGLMVVDSSDYDLLQRSDSRKLDHSGIQSLAMEKGLVAVPKGEFEELQSEITDEALHSTAIARGYALLTNDEYQSLMQLKDAAENVTDVENFEDASPEELVTLTKEEYARLQDTQSEANVSRSVQADDNQKVTEISVGQLEERASALGFSLVTSEELQKLRSHKLSANELAFKAAELDLVLISQQAYDDLKSTSVSGSDMVETARKLGQLCIPETAYIPTTVAPTADVNNVVVLPKTYYNKLARSHALSIERMSKEELMEHCRKRGIALGDDIPDAYTGHTVPAQQRDTLSPQPSFSSPALASGFKPASPLLQSPVQNFASPNSHMKSSPSAFSIATNVSLTDRKMIPALTQTIIGEYLYKYYRRLGAFSSISENRHERYFWIHPYSLTLYWSASNPVIGDPSTNKIRAAAILKVEVVEDNNPLPPGLYHKSIIVHSSDRRIKITCPTRQRHNVWYNSLRYLIERTTDGLDFGNAVADTTLQESHLRTMANMEPTIEEDENENVAEMDTYRYLKPRSSMINKQRSVSNPTRKNSRLFSPSLSSIQRSATFGSLHNNDNKAK